MLRDSTFTSCLRDSTFLSYRRKLSFSVFYVDYGILWSCSRAYFVCVSAAEPVVVVAFARGFCLGPVCIPFSPMGTRKGQDDPRFAGHESYYDKYKAICDIFIVENVVEYGDVITKDRLGEEWEVESLKLDPRNLGLGVARARIYLLRWKKTKVTWDAPFTLRDFLDTLASKPVLSAKNYFWQKIPPTVLSEAEASWQH